MFTNEIFEAPKSWGLPPIDMQSPLVEQGYGNTCAVRCQQLILQDFGIHVSEEELAEYAINKGWFTDGTPMIHVGNLLVDYGVPVSRLANGNIFTLTSELAQGHRVIVSVDADELWKDGTWEQLQDAFGPQPNHALIVAGIDTSNPEDIRVHLMDPGTGDIAKSYPLSQFMDAWEDSGFHMVATTEPPPPGAFGMDNFDYTEFLHLPDIAGVPYAEFERFNLVAENHKHDPDFIEKLSDDFQELIEGKTTVPKLLNELFGEEASPQDVPIPDDALNDLNAELQALSGEEPIPNIAEYDDWADYFRDLSAQYEGVGNQEKAAWYNQQNQDPILSPDDAPDDQIDLDF